MSTKINLQQLAKTLAQKKNLSQKNAEAFLKEFFDSIIQNVTTDKLVKIKGLGTFKLIEVLDRESVNVNTGERFIIPGHSKLSFTPETALKDLINKPFADFQTVIINEGTSIEEMERVPQEEEEDIEPEEEQDVQVQQSQAEEEKDTEAETDQVQKPVDKIAVLYGPPPTKVDSLCNTHPQSEEESASKPKTDDEKPHRSYAKIVAWIVGILLLCLLCFFAGRLLTQKSSTTTAPQKEEVKTEVPEEPSIAAPAEAPAEEVQYAQVPGGKYKIVGTRKTYVMKPGDFITRIAIQEYGDKDIAQYIIVHNAFPDPDNVPVNSEIKLPDLEPVE